MWPEGLRLVYQLFQLAPASPPSSRFPPVSVLISSADSLAFFSIYPPNPPASGLVFPCTEPEQKTNREQEFSTNQTKARHGVSSLTCAPLPSGAIAPRCSAALPWTLQRLRLVAGGTTAILKGIKIPLATPPKIGKRTDQIPGKKKSKRHCGREKT